MSKELIEKAIEKLEKHYPYEDESGIIKVSLGRYMNALQYLRQFLEEYDKAIPYALDKETGVLLYARE
jgi:hypothetical protein